MRYTALSTATVTDLRAGGLDAYGQTAEVTVSDGSGNPCRHCLRDVPKDAKMLILAHRPFDDLHPYAETGPIFLCADPCVQGGGDRSPEILQTSPDYLLKGYNSANRIVYGTGAVVDQSRIEAHAAQVFEDPAVAYIHVRSARNNCYQVRIDRS